MTAPTTDSTVARPQEQSETFAAPARGRLVLALLIFYAVYATADGVRLAVTFDGRAVGAAAVVWLLVSAVWSTSLAVRLRGSPTATPINRFAAIAIVACFIVGFADYTLWIGILTAAAILIAGRARLRRLSPSSRRFWLTLHIAASVGWLGVGLVMVALSWLAITPASGLARTAYEIIHFLDIALIIPLVLLSILSGVVVSLGSKWGLIQHWWVLVKLVISLTIVGVATAFEHFWVIDLARRLTENVQARPGAIGLQLAVTLTAFVVSLLVATVLSVYKPRGRTRWGDHALTRQHARMAVPQRTRSAP